MKTAVRYYSRGGNTAEIARAIAEGACTQALPVTAGLDGPVDLLFLGGAPYAFHLAAPLRDFIRSLDPAAVRAVCAFSTSGSPLGASRMIMKKCQQAGLHVIPQEFHCRGPEAASPEEKKKAEQFAESVTAAGI